jgi:cellulose synthase/poly-beta-1,6-N-acetylglucosamine synthase-like glycosyltransferase
LIGIVTAAIVGLTSLLLFLFGLNILYLTVRALRLSRSPSGGFAAAPPLRGEEKVCVQIPIYNERYVAERVLDAVCAIDWPRELLQVQVLDDSDDDTTRIVARRLEHWRRRGLDVTHVRRGSRTGFKAGALAHGMELTDAPFLAIFDADFVPPRDFLRRTVGAFGDPSVGFVQARWGHLDEDYSLFTRLQAMAIDFHFLVEQAVRSASGYFTNFTGTAGVWRRTAIDDAGGWSARTLTEDLDLSYRAQLRGWRAEYIEDLVVPEELPVSIDAYRRQQSRWATGSFQSAFKLLGPVMRSRARVAVKFQAAVHLLSYGVGPVMLVQLACYPLLLLAFGRHGLQLPWYLADSSAVSILVGVTPFFGFVAAQTRRRRTWWRGLPSMLCQVVGAGMSLNALLALGRSVRPGGVFVRTPKHRIVQPGQQWRNQAYVRVGDPRALLEGLIGLAALALVPIALAVGQNLIAIYAGMFALGFLVVATLSLVDFLEVVARPRVRLSPAPALFAAVAVLLLAAAQLPEPFEDGYGHWLIAANLASTGSLHDPLFGMEDTWLPGYHVLAAAVLHLFGLWQLGALKALSALLGLATAAAVYALAPNPRQGRLAVVLLSLNPVFLFTSGSAVVEPLLTALLMAAALAAVRGRMRLAALLAALACATSTKAWIWLVAAAAFALLEGLRLKQRRTAVAWAMPGIAVLVFMQLGFAPAAHSVSRGSIELVSASARGSVPAGAFGRVWELASTYGLASLPLFAFGSVGAVVALARRTVTPLGRFVYVPAAIYLAAVFGLVAAGAYTGSHRYLYPALPAIALLAAAALDRYGRGVRLAAAGASALLAVAFLPVFAGFADSNAGLVAAGRAASPRLGMLLTDSPAVAYYSGKKPAQVVGSQALPADRDAAIAWMRAHGVTTLVLENISYYRSTSLFPELAHGQEVAPFASLGRQDGYQVTYGKPVYAYRLPPLLDLSGVAEGKSSPLAKGVTMGPAATGEGMGFGVPIVYYRDGWVFARTATTVQVGPSTWQRTFELDEMGGDRAHNYAFVPVASRGEVQVTYAIDANGVTITVRPISLAPGYIEVGILNEQSAAFDDFAAEGGSAVVGRAFGNWMPVTGAWARLRSGSLGIEWSAPSLPDANLYAGRELAAPDFNWAGLDYMFSAGSFTGASYRINVQEAQ